MKRSLIRKRRSAFRRSVPASRPRPLGVSLACFSSIAALCGALTAGVGSAKAATYYWDADGIINGNNFSTGVGLGGSGIWNTAGLNWWDTATNIAWPNAAGGDTAFFTGPAGVVQLGGDIKAGGLTFNNTGYNIADGSAGSRLTLAGSGAINLNGAGTTAINTILDGSAGLTLTGTGLTSVLALNHPANVYTGTNTITSGTLSIAGDGSLGHPANGITFNGAALGGLTFQQSMTLGAGRTLSLGTGATATLTSALNAGVYLLGKVTGDGNLTLVNSGVTNLLNTANDFTGTLWAQNGTVSLASLADVAGGGNVRLGNGGSAGTLQWASGATSALKFTNRTLEMAGTTGGLTIDNSAMLVSSTVTINNFAVTGNGNKTLQLTGTNAGTNVFAANIVDSTGTTGFTKNGTALWVLSGNNTFTGNISIGAGTTRVTGNTFGTGAGAMTFSSSSTSNLTLLEFRNENSINFAKNITNNAGVNQTIYVDRAIGGSASGKVFTLGTVNQVNNTATISFVGDHGYGVSLGQAILTRNSTAGSGSSFGYTNNLGAPGYKAPGYTNGVLSLAGVTSDTLTNTGGSTQVLSGWGDFVINGAVTSPSGTAFPVNINKTGVGILTLPGANGTGTGSDWTAGTLSLSGGTTRLTLADQIGTGGATISLTGGLLELRSDTSLNFGTKIGGISGTSTVLVDRTIGGTGTGSTMTLGTVNANNTATVNVVGDKGHALTLGLTTITGGKTFTLNNYLAAPGYGGPGYTPGVLTLSGLTTDNTAGAATIVLGGFGDFNAFDGTGSNPITSPNAGTPLNITKSAIGVQNFSGDNSGWTVGTLTSAGGTTLLDATNANVIGTANLATSGGLLGILSATGTANTAPWNAKNLTVSGTSTLALDPLAGSGALNQTVNLGALGGSGTLLVDSNHGYNLAFNAAGSIAGSTTLTNVGNGAVTFNAGLSTTAGSTLILNGVGDFNVAGAITNGTGTMTVAKNGYGVVTLGNANTIGGSLTVNSGVLRITNAGAFGGVGTLTMQGGNNSANGVASLDFRNDVGMDLSSRNFTTNGFNFLMNVDRGLGGSGVNQTMMVGGGSIANANNWGFAVTGAHGYSLQFGSATNATPFTLIQGTSGGTNYTVNNFLPSNAGNGAIVFNSGITFANTTFTGTLNLAGTGDYLLSGALNNAVATVATTLNKNGFGTLTLSGDNSVGFNQATISILTLGSGLTRVTNSNALGGANTTVNLNGGASLGLRSDAALNFANTTISLGSGAFATINSDASLGATGTNNTTHTLSGVKGGSSASTVFLTGGTQSGANAYNLGITTFTAGASGTAAAPTLVNSIGNNGALNIGTLTGANFAAVINGAGATNITAGLTLGTGALTKSGLGTLTISGNSTNTNGAVTVNGGTLALDYSGGAADNLLQSAALTLSQGTLSVKGNGTAASQGMTTLTFGAGQNNITMLANGGTSNTLAFSGALTSSVAGSTGLISAPAGTAVNLGAALNTAATTGRNLVFFDGTNYNWATNTAGGAATIANNDALAAAAVQYAPLATAAGTDTSNSQIQNAALTTLGGARTTNSLMIDTSTAGGVLDLAAVNLTLTQGGVLFAGANAFEIRNSSATTGLKSATSGNSDTVINNYGTGVLTISAPIIAGAGTTTLTLGGTGKTIIGNAGIGGVGTYTGTTFINGGTVQLAPGVLRLGNTTASSLAVNGGTLDLNGNNLGIGLLNGTAAGSAAGVIDNTSASPATLTINGSGTTASVFNGTIRNSGGALSLVKTGTGALTLGDAITGGSNLFTGNLTISGASTVTLNSLADAAGSKVDFNATGAGLTFVGRANLSLTNRAFDISAAGGSATITSSSAAGSINGTNPVLFIGSNFAPTGTGALSLTLAGTAGNVANGGTGTGAGDGASGITGTGNVALVNAFNGNISNGAADSLALTISGSGGWSLGGNNSYTGLTTLSSTGLVRATSGTAFGLGQVNLAGTGTLDLRSDSSLTFANQFQLNASTTINVDRAIGGSGYGGIMNLGTMTVLTAGRTLTVTNQAGTNAFTGSSNNINGYGLHLAGLALNAGTGLTITNAIGAPGAALMTIPAAGTGVAGAFVIDGVSAGLAGQTLTLGAAQNTSSTTIINGDLTQADGATLGLTIAASNSGHQVTLSGQTAATNYSGGVTLANSTSVVRVTNQYALGSGPLTFSGGGTLEVRNDANVTYANDIVMAASGRIAVGEAINGTSGRNKTVTFGSLVLQGTSGTTMTIGGIAASNDNSGHSVNFGGVRINGNVNDTITNNLLLPGVLNLGDVVNSFTTTPSTQTLSIGGSGVTTLGNVTDAPGNGLTGITHTGSGVLDLTRATGVNTYTGGLTVGLGGNGGIVRANSANNLGGATNIITFGGTGTLELRSDAGFTVPQQVNVGAGLSTLTLGQLAGTGSASYGANFVLGGIVTPSATAKVLFVNPIAGTSANGANLTINRVDFGTGGAVNNLGINNNLPIPSVMNIGMVTNTLTSTAATLTIGGSGVTTLGNVFDGAPGSSTAIVYGGTGFLNLQGDAANLFGGGFRINSGTVRATTPTSFGTGLLTLGGGTLEIRTDDDLFFFNAVTQVASTTIALGQLPGGAGATGKLVSFGDVNVNGGTLTVSGIGGTSAANGYSLSLGTLTLGNATTGLTNQTPLPSSVSIGGITSGVAGTNTFSLGGTSSLTTINGPITNGAGVTAITVSANAGAVVAISGVAGTDYSGGLNLTGSGIVRTFGANAFGASTGVIALTGSGGTLDVRTDSNLTILNNVTVATNSPIINVDQIAAGNTGKTVTFGGAATTLNTTAKSLTLTSSNGYGMTFTNGFSLLTAGYTLTNNASGPVNLGNISSTVATGTFTLGGSGMSTVGRISSTTATSLALTYSGNGILDLTGNTGAANANAMSGLTISGGGGLVKVSSPANLGATNAPVTFTATGTPATLQVRTDNAGVSNGTIAFNNPLVLNASSQLTTLDLGNAGGPVTGNTVAFGAVTNPTAQAPTTLTVNGANGYKLSLASVSLSAGTGHTFNLTANVPVTITGNVSSPSVGFTTSNFSTIQLDGAVGGAVNGVISDAPTASLTANGLTRITKQGIGTWTLGSVNTNLGLNSVLNGTLKLGATNALNPAGQGTNVIAAGTATVPAVAVLDLNGFNQTFGLGTSTVSGTQTSALILGGGSALSQPIVTDSVGTSTITLAGASTTGDIQYSSSNNPLGGIISVNTLNLGNAARTFNVGDSSNAGADLLITSAISNGSIVKSGAGTLHLSGAQTVPAGTASYFTVGAATGSLLVSGPVTATSNQTWSNGTATGTLYSLLQVGGKLNLGANSLTVSGVGETLLSNTAGGTGANVLGALNVTGGVLGGMNVADGITGRSSSLGTSAITLSGTNPTLRLSPALGTTLAGGITPGLAAKSFTGVGSLAATNFLGATSPTTAHGGNYAYLNLPTGSGTIANLPTFAAASNFSLNTSIQFTGLLNITTAGVYNFSTTTDDGAILVIDGETLASSAGVVPTGSIYLTAGLHVFNERMNNAGGSGTVSVRYQGPDNNNVMGDIPASVLFQANSAADLATTFTNNISLAATTNAAIEVSSNTTLTGSITMTGTGTGTTLNVLGSGNLNTLTVTGPTTLTGDLAIVTPTANLTLNSGISGAFAITKTGFGTLALTAASTYSGGTNINGGIVRFDTNLSRLGTGGISFGGGTLQWGTGNTTDVSARAITFTAAAGFDTNGNNVTLASPIGGTAAFGFTKTGAGTLYLSATNAFGAATTGSNININGGTVKIDAETGLGNVLNDVVFGGGGAGTLQITNGFTLNAGKTISVTAAGGGTLQIDAGTVVQSATNQIVGTTGTGGLIKTGAGTLNLNQSNSSYDATGVGTNGATNVGFRIDAGTLLISGASNSVLGDINPNTMTVQLNGGNLSIQTDTASIGRANLWVSNASSNISVDRASAGAGIAQAIGTGTGAGLTMGAGSSVLNVSGGSNITSGTEAVSFTGTASLMVSPTFNVNNATGGGAVTLTLGALNDNGVLRTITKSGTGTLILGTATTTLTDGTQFNVSGGTLASNNATALGLNGSAMIDVASGATFLAGADQTVAKITGLGNVSIGSGFTLTYGGSTFSSVLTGSAGGTFAKAGTGELLINSASPNYLGALAVQGGAVRLAGGDNRLGAASTVVLGNGANSGTLIIGGDASGNPGADPSSLNRVSQTIAGLSVSGTGTTNRVIGGAAGGTSNGTPSGNSVLTISVPTGVTNTYSGLIGWDGTGSRGFQNNLNLVISGAGTQVLSGDLTNWTGTMDDSANPGLTDEITDPTRPTLSIQSGALRATGVLNTLVLQTGGIFDDQTVSHGANFYLKMTGGVAALSQQADSFASSGLSSSSMGVAALNISGNTGVTNFAGSNLYLGAIGARSFAPVSLAPGAGNIYRLGGGAPLNGIGAPVIGGSGGNLQIASNALAGTANVVIGDNSNTLVGGLSTVEFVSGQSYSGTTTVLGGTLAFNNVANALGTNTAANSILLDGGALNNGYNAILRWGTGTTTDLSARIGIVSGGTIDTGANNVTFATAIANANSGNGGLNKIGSGTLTLTKATAYTGPTTVTQGTLLLDLNALAGNDLLRPDSAGLFMAGGNLTVKGTGATTQRSQAINGTTFVAGASTITPALSATGTGTPNLTVALGPLNRNAGATANLAVYATGNNANANNTFVTQSSQSVGNQAIMSASGAAYMTFGTSTTSVRDWAVTDATTPAKIVQAPVAFYNTTWATTPTAAPANSNLDIGANSPTFTPAVAGDNAFATLRFDSSTGARTVTLNNPTAGTATYSLGGILNTSNVGNQLQQISGSGVLQGANGGSADLVIHNWNGAYLTATGSASSSTNAYFKINTVIGGSSGVTIAGSPQSLTWLAATNNYPGATTVNGSFAYVPANIVGGVPSLFGTSSADAANFVLNGGGLYDNSSSTINFSRLFSLGVNGGTLMSESTGAFNFNGSFNGSNAIGFIGTGARTLTLSGSGNGANTLGLLLSDNGGPTGILKMGTGLWILGTAQSYTGATTIANGALRVSTPNALPGGLGVLGTVTPATSGGGALVFAGTGTTQAVFELTPASGNFYRSAGTGADQVQWTGNGGFSAVGADMSVNLGGSATPSGLFWGSAGFVTTGNLQLGSALATNRVIFQNPIDFNGATRTIQVNDGPTIIEAELSGVLSNANATAATFTKSGAGTLLLTANNSLASNLNTAVTGGTLAFADTNAIPGLGRTVTVSANGAVLLPGATDLTPLLSRLSSTSTGVVALDVSSSAPIDLSDAALGNVYLGAYSAPGGTPIYYNGTITTGSNNTYKFSNVASASPTTTFAGINQNANLLVLNGSNMLTNNGATPRSAIFGGNSTAQGGTGTIYVTGYNSYTGGTTIGQATGAAATSTVVGVGNDSALGTGLLTFSDGRMGSLNGDHTLSNNLKSTGTSGNMALGGGLTSDFVVNAGGFTFLGTADFSSLTSGGVFTRTAQNPAIFLGDVKTNASNNLSLVTNSNGPVTLVEFLTTPAGAVPVKTMSNGARGFTLPGANPGGSGIVIDSAGSLGPAPAANVAAFINLGGITNATVQVLPGITAPIALSANQGLTMSSGNLFAFAVNGSPTINDSTGTPTTGLIGNSNLTFPGVISGASSGSPALSKLGYGTVTLQGANTVGLTATNGLSVWAGTMRLDFANTTGSIFSATGGPNATAPIGVFLGVSSGNVGLVSSLVTGNATLELLGKSGQTNAQVFGPVTNAARDNNLVLNANGGTLNLTLGQITNTQGGTLAVTLPSQGSITIAAGNTTIASGSAASGTGAGLLVDANLNPYVIVGGNEWGAKNATNNIVAGSTFAANFYTANTATAFTTNTNADLTTNVTLSAATTAVNSLRLNAAAALNLNIGGATNILTAPGILMGTGTASNAQTISNGILRGSASKGLTIYQANSAAALSISAVIADNTAASILSKGGPGLLELTGTNSYTGATYLNGGTVSIPTVTNGAVNGPLGAASNAASSLLFNGGSLQYTGATATTDRGATFNSVGAIDVTQAGTTLTLTSGTSTILGLANTPGILRKIGAGALTIGGTTGNNTNLSVEVAAGTLNLGKTGAGFALQQANGAALIVNAGATARVTGSATTQIEQNSSVVIRTGGQLDLNSTGLTFDGLAGGGLVTSATGAPLLTLGMGNNAAISAYTVGAAAAGVASTGLNNFSGVISGTLGLSKVGAGTQILSGSSTYSGGTAINAGTLKLGIANALPSGALKGDVSLSGGTVVNGLIVPGTLDLGGYDQAINALNSTTGGVVVNTPTVAFTTAWGTPYGTTATTGTSTLSVGNGDASGAFNGTLQDGFSVLPVAGAGAGTGVNGVLALRKVGAGTQLLSGVNTYSGGTIIDGGTVQINSTASLGALTSSVVINSGTLQATADITTSRSIQLGSANSTISVDAAKTYSVSGAFSDGVSAGTLNKAGSGTLVLTGANGYTGGTNVAAGTLQVGNGGTAGALGSGPITTGTNATLAINHSDTVTVATAINGSGNFAQTGSGTTILTAANNYAGTTTISSGTLQVGNGGSTGDLGAGTVTNNANLNFMRSDAVTIASTIGGSGTITQNGSVLSLNGAVTGQAVHVVAGQVKLGLGDTVSNHPNHSLTALTLDGGTSLQIASGGGLKLVQATSLTLAGTARLDLTSNAFVLDYAGSVENTAQTAAFAALLHAGFNGGLWDGMGGINTSKVGDDLAANPASYQFLTGIGYMPGSLTGGTFLGRPVDAGSVVARYTYYGDANLDGVVNGLDYGLIDSGFANQNAPGFVYSWVNGDFNYDGRIDGADYALMDTAAAFSNGAPIAPVPAGSFASADPAPTGVPDAEAGPAPEAQVGSLPTAVPEPASFGLLMLGGAVLGLRRRRKPTAKLN